MSELTIRPSTVYISSSYGPRYSPQSIYTSSPTSYSSLTSPTSSKPTLSPTSRHQSSALSRPSTIYTSANIAQSFKVVRRQRTRKSNSSRRGAHNLLNQTLDNFYNILRRTKTDQTVKSAKNWVNEYECYRNSVIYEEKEYERYRSSMMMLDDDDDDSNRVNEGRRYDGSSHRNSTCDNQYSHRSSMYDRSSSGKNSTYENYSSPQYLHVRGASSGVTERRTNGVSAISGRRQQSKNSVGVEDRKVGEPLYSNYF